MSDNFLSYCTSLDYLCHECPTCYVNQTETDISQEKSDQDVVYGCIKSQKIDLHKTVRMARYGYVGGKIKYEAQFKLLCPQDTPIPSIFVTN